MEDACLLCTVKLPLCMCPPPPNYYFHTKHLVEAAWLDNNLVHVKELSCSTHIMKKMPPQSAVQERLVGSSLACRPMGPSRRPRRLHTTTRRTRKHTVKPTLHLREDICLYNTQLPVHLTTRKHVAFGASHLMLSICRICGASLLSSLCTCSMFCDTLDRAARGI